MEKSNPAKYSENITPSAPAISGIDDEDFMYQSTNGTHSGFVNAGFQDEQNSNFGPPPQQPSNAKFMPHEPDTNDSYCGNFLRNRRQASSVAGGRRKSYLKKEFGFHFIHKKRDNPSDSHIFYTFY